MKSNEMNHQRNETELQVVVMPQSYLKKQEAQIEKLINLLEKKSEEEINSQWIESVKSPKCLA